MQDDVGGLEVEDPKNPGHFQVCTPISHLVLTMAERTCQSVPPVEGAIIVNAGDFLMRCKIPFVCSKRLLERIFGHIGSNDYIRSTIHRVRAPPNLTTSDGMTPERYSMPYVRSSGSI